MYHRLRETRRRLRELQWHRLRSRLPFQPAAELQWDMYRTERGLQRDLSDRPANLQRRQHMHKHRGARVLPTSGLQHHGRTHGCYLHQQHLRLDVRYGLLAVHLRLRGSHLGQFQLPDVWQRLYRREDLLKQHV
jgi:hypothetical protein